MSPPLMSGDYLFFTGAAPEADYHGLLKTSDHNCSFPERQQTTVKVRHSCLLLLLIFVLTLFLLLQTSPRITFSVCLQSTSVWSLQQSIPPQLRYRFATVFHLPASLSHHQDQLPHGLTWASPPILVNIHLLS